MDNQLVEDSYKLISKIYYLINSEGDQSSLAEARNKAVAFALGSKEPSILIELLNLDPLLYSNGVLSGVVDEVLSNESFAKTPKGKHLTALKQYAIENPEFQKINGYSILETINDQNKFRAKVEECESLIEVLTCSGSLEFKSSLEAKRKELNSAAADANCCANSLKGWKSEELFEQAKMAYFNEYKIEEFKVYYDKGSEKNAISDKFNAHLIDKKLDPYKKPSEDYEPVGLLMHGPVDVQFLSASCSIEDCPKEGEDAIAIAWYGVLGDKELTAQGMAYMNLGFEMMQNNELSSIL